LKIISTIFLMKNLASESSLVGLKTESPSIKADVNKSRKTSLIQILSEPPLIITRAPESSSFIEIKSQAPGDLNSDSKPRKSLKPAILSFASSSSAELIDFPEMPHSSLLLSKNKSPKALEEDPSILWTLSIL